jgi:hypothetical protein
MSSPVFPDSPTVLRAREAAQAQIAAAAEAAAGASEDTVADFSQRLLRTFLGLCENPRTRQGMLRMVRSSGWR